MKRITYIIATILLVFCFKIDLISAVTNVCDYDKGLKVSFDESGTATINQEFYKEKKIPYILNSVYNYNSGSISATETLEFQEKELMGSCPETLYVCKYEEASYESGLANLFSTEHGLINVINKIYIFYSEGEMKQNSTLKDLKNNEVEYGSQFTDSWVDGYEACSGYDAWFLDEVTGWLCSNGNALIVQPIAGIWSYENFYIKYKECFSATYTGEGPTYNLACPNLNVYLGRFNDALNEYKKCSDTDAVCISKNVTNVNNAENVIKDYCGAILENHNYDGGTEQDCLEACMDIAVQTKKAKVAAGLESEGSGTCGVSGRLLVWISNILRWVKYILPVIVIVFGILDFIKAMGADKEDEMKKAQGKFVRRLIAAALVFIVPLILEFVLDKMGFGYDDCGLF